MYIAASALRISSSAPVTVPAGANEMPRLARIASWLSSISIGARERLEDPLGGLGGGLHVLDVLEQDRELVAAEPGRRVGGAHAGRDPLGDLDEHRVAGGVAE